MTRLALLTLAVTATSLAADEKLAGIACRSVHLGYRGPAAVAFYNEATVTRSAPGTYFCACGFDRGYFGIQEKGDGSKVVIFSVWDPSAGDDPKTVPDEKRVKTLAKGDGVRVGRFGGEGTGGQSFLDLDWKVGDTVRFLVTAAPDGPDRTAYTGFVRGPVAKAWAKMATFSTPTGKPRELGGFYSFVEDFKRDKVSATKPRSAEYGPAWVKTAKGEWLPLGEARFTADGNPSLAIDAGPGTAAGRYFLATGGDTANATTKLRDPVKAKPSDAKPVPPADLPDH